MNNIVSQYKTSILVDYCYNDYNTRHEPAFFLEPFSENDFAILFLHSSTKVIVWKKESLEFADKFKLIPKLKKLKYVIHIAYTATVSSMLEQYGFDHFFLPDFVTYLCSTRQSFQNQYYLANQSNQSSGKSKIVPDTIYLDIPITENNQDVIKTNEFNHLLDLYFKIIQINLDIKFIINKNLEKVLPAKWWQKMVSKFNVEENFVLNPVIDLPLSCFLVINLTDIITNDIYRLGKERGIDTVNNECTEYSIEWTNINSIQEIINSEREDFYLNIHLNKKISQNQNTTQNQNSNQNTTQVIKSNDEDNNFEVQQLSYDNLDYYRLPFQKNYDVTVTVLARDLFKIIKNKSKYSTPGIFQEHFLEAGKSYLIKVYGYENGMNKGRVNLWIGKQLNDGRKRKTILFDSKNSLPSSFREGHSLKYIYTNKLDESDDNGGDGYYLIGLLFHEAEDGSNFISQSLEVIPL